MLEGTPGKGGDGGIWKQGYGWLMDYKQRQSRQKARRQCWNILGMRGMDTIQVSAFSVTTTEGYLGERLKELHVDGL